jgi:hypothetical protein
LLPVTPATTHGDHLEPRQHTTVFSSQDTLSVHQRVPAGQCTTAGRLLVTHELCSHSAQLATGSDPDLGQVQQFAKPLERTTGHTSSNTRDVLPQCGHCLARRQGAAPHTACGLHLLPRHMVHHMSQAAHHPDMHTNCDRALHPCITKACTGLDSHPGNCVTRPRPHSVPGGPPLPKLVLLLQLLPSAATKPLWPALPLLLSCHTQHHARSNCTLHTHLPHLLPFPLPRGKDGAPLGPTLLYKHAPLMCALTSQAPRHPGTQAPWHRPPALFASHRMPWTPVSNTPAPPFPPHGWATAHQAAPCRMEVDDMQTTCPHANTPAARRSPRGASQLLPSFQSPSSKNWQPPQSSCHAHRHASVHTSQPLPC